MKTKLIIFITLIAAFFSFCFAEDFWMKLGFEDATYKMHYTIQDEIYITKLEVPKYSFRSLDSGFTWENYHEVLDYPIVVGGVEYISDDGNYLYVRSLDSLYIVHKDSSDLRKLLDLGFMTMSKVKDNFYFLTWGIIKSDKDLKDTTFVYEGDNGTEYFKAIVADSAGTLYAGSTNFKYDGGLYKSYDNGDTWIGPGPSLLNDYIRAMAVDSEGRIFVGTAGHATLYTGRIYRSEDNGESWNQVAGNGVYVQSMAINSEDEIFAGLSDDWGFLGIAYSDDHGDTWSFLNEGLGGAGGINDIAISPDGYVYLATDGGVYRSINSTGIEDNDELLITSYELEQNYPNPFNNQTSIDYGLNKISEVEISIYNTKGQFVKNLVNGVVNAGMHSATFKADKFNSGIYYYRLKVDGKVKETKKMLYLR